MRMFALLAVAALPGVALAADAPTAPGKGCHASAPQLVAGDGKAVARRLDQLPPAAEMLPVIRSVAGCQTPVVVRYGIGGDPALGGGQAGGRTFSPSGAARPRS